MYFNCEIKDKEKNKPVVFFTRKPGMIVSYEDVGAWVDGIIPSNKDEFILAIFVLNSNNTLEGTDKKYSLEEYARKSEMADHSSWGDFSIGKLNPRIISKVQRLVTMKISKDLSVDEEENVSKLSSGLGKMFGDLLLPPENFGKKPSTGVHNPPTGGKQIEKHKNIVFEYDASKTKYRASEMTVVLRIIAKKKIKETGIILAIDSDSGAISVNDWEKRLGMRMPFEISSCIINVIKLNDNGCQLKYSLDIKQSDLTDNEVECKLMKTDSNTINGIHIIMGKEASIEIEISVVLKLHRKDIKPLFIMEKNGGDT
jgi:hypothetical protein